MEEEQKKFNLSGVIALIFFIVSLIYLRYDNSNFRPFSYVISIFVLICLSIIPLKALMKRDEDDKRVGMTLFKYGLTVLVTGVLMILVFFGLILSYIAIVSDDNVDVIKVATDTFIQFMLGKTDVVVENTKNLLGLLFGYFLLMLLVVFIYNLCIKSFKKDLIFATLNPEGENEPTQELKFTYTLCALSTFAVLVALGVFSANMTGLGIVALGVFIVSFMILAFNILKHVQNSDNVGIVLNLLAIVIFPSLIGFLISPRQEK